MIHEAVAIPIAIKAKRQEKYNGCLEYLYIPLVIGLSIGVVRTLITAVINNAEANKKIKSPI